MKKDKITIEYFQKNLNLQPHPEGGFYRETYRSENEFDPACLDGDFKGSRNVSTAIYFLLTAENFSAFHRIKQDEVWHFYAGDPLDVHIIDPMGNYELLKIGSNLQVGQQFQGVVKAGSWFASNVAKGGKFSLVGCTVAPGFDFRDFEMAKKVALLNSYPQHEEIISRFCRS